MVIKGKIILKKKADITYIIKAGEKVIWEGKNVHKKYGAIHKHNKDKELAVCWKSDQENPGVQI